MSDHSFRDRLRESGSWAPSRGANSNTPPKLRRFYLNRVRDESGVSGTGVVAVGVVMPSGHAVMEWTSTRTGIPGFEFHTTIENVEAIHGHGGATEVKFYDGDEADEREDTEEADPSPDSDSLRKR